MFRSLSKDFRGISDLRLNLTDVEISTLRVGKRSPSVGKSLAEIELRKRYGVTILAIRRDLQILSNPGGDTKLYANDVLVILGPPNRIAGVTGLFCNP